MYFEDFKEGDSFKFIANVNVYKQTWDGKETDKTRLTKDNAYNGVIEKDLGQLVIKFKDDQGDEHFMSYEYADGKIDILEEVSE